MSDGSWRIQIREQKTMRTITEKSPVVFWIGSRGFVVTGDEASKLVALLSGAPMVDSHYDGDNEGGPRLRYTKGDAELKVTQVGPAGILSVEEAAAYDRRQNIRYRASDAFRSEKKAREADDDDAASEAHTQWQKAVEEADAIGYGVHVDNPKSEWPNVRLVKAAPQAANDNEIVSND
jgi:hypothetical protein